MRLTIEVPDSEAPNWIQRLRALGISLISSAPETAFPALHLSANEVERLLEINEAPYTPTAPMLEAMRRARQQIPG